MTDTHAFRHEPRQRLSDQQRAKLFLDRGGKCHACGRKLRSGDDWIAEHVTALQVGGGNEWANLAVTCAWCLPKKNATDAAKAAKGRAVAVASIIPTSQRQKKGRPIDGSKRSRWKKKMDGTVERR